MNKPPCKLVGTDGNVFSIIGKVSKALKAAGMAEEAKVFCARAMSAKSYDEVLCLAMEFTEVT